ncbi:hypothetical protein [Nitrogeniibacter aestuarii]|uniref:hypothetical protein n=1 Tax=Nitrogeniibacter aestuarii TaxID=2815343 RepID=UPI001E54F2E4|nr:hypothetical protein [Nitrogeniibacter aestuarii]
MASLTLGRHSNSRLIGLASARQESTRFEMTLPVGARHHRQPGEQHPTWRTTPEEAFQHEIRGKPSWRDFGTRPDTQEKGPLTRPFE